MAIDPNNTDAVAIPQLDPLVLALETFLVGANEDGKMGKFTAQELANFIAPYVSAIGGSAYIPVSGTVLPNSTSIDSGFTFVTAGTYTQTTGGNIVTTALINILSWNGTTWSLSTAIPITVPTSKIVGWTATTFATGSQVNYGGQIWEAVTNTTSGQVPGVVAESIWKHILDLTSPSYGFSAATQTEVDRPDVQATTTYGVNSPGNSGSDNVGSATIVKTNEPRNLITSNGVLKTINARLGDGTVFFSIGELVDNIFVIRKVLPVFTSTGGLNWKTYNVNEQVYAGEMVVMGGANGGTATVRFQLSGAAGNRYAQYHTYDTNHGYGGDTSFYAFYVTVDSVVPKPLDVFVRKTGLQPALSDYFLTEQLSTIVKTFGGASTSDSTIVAATNRYLLSTKTGTPYNAKCKQIRIYAVTAGSIIFSVGLIDQANKWIESRTFTKVVAAGSNVLSVDEGLIEGQMIAIKTTPSDIGLLAGAGSYYLSTVGDNTITTVATAALTFQYDVYEVYRHAAASGEEVDNLQEQVDDLKIEKPVIISSIPSAVKFKLVCDDDGSNLRAISLYPSNTLVLGNSITKHPVTSYWWGSWGMAASLLVNDFVHRLQTMIRVNLPSANVTGLNISTFESSPGTFNYNSINADLVGKDYVIIRLGENVNSTNLPNLATNLGLLVAHIRSQVDAQIAISGNFWYSPDRDVQLQLAAANAGVPFIPLSDLDIAPNKSYIGAIVSGDDGLPHTVDNAGVAQHPNDTGMLKIAERLYNLFQ